MKVWVPVDIGCIECGEPSAVLGVFRSRQEALDAFSEHIGEEVTDDGMPFFTNGQHYAQVFECDLHFEVKK